MLTEQRTTTLCGDGGRAERPSYHHVGLGPQLGVPHVLGSAVKHVYAIVQVERPDRSLEQITTGFPGVDQRPERVGMGEGQGKPRHTRPTSEIHATCRGAQVYVGKER